ncbi:DUF3152 domain-containing protein [Streptomyces sp. NBC_00525]|nr:DUF3152 domain-containing protein [Streptomyces sp. NBC_00525]WUC97748.1 DUF3152 domain-containing protein [Streptomyces sp. NBC_00525]
MRGQRLAVCRERYISGRTSGAVTILQWSANPLIWMWTEPIAPLTGPTAGDGTADHWGGAPMPDWTRRRGERGVGGRSRLLALTVVPVVLVAAVVAGLRWNSTHGPGSTPTFTMARAAATGGGRGHAYRVEVEDGSGVDADKAASVVARILAAPRGWAHRGEQTFRQVADGPAGLVIRIATPETTDRICGKSGLDTHGEVNCRVGTDVMVNLKRWQTGSPEFDGPLGEYRALIINHEVGHWLGRGHETCPGKGRPAPAMMQQIDGLKGCVANAWPYDAQGRYLGGPPVP